MKTYIFEIIRRNLVKAKVNFFNSDFFQLWTDQKLSFNFQNKILFVISVKSDVKFSFQKCSILRFFLTLKSLYNGKVFYYHTSEHLYLHSHATSSGNWHISTEVDGGQTLYWAFKKDTFQHDMQFYIAGPDRLPSALTYYMIAAMCLTSKFKINVWQFNLSKKQRQLFYEKFQGEHFLSEFLIFHQTLFFVKCILLWNIQSTRCVAILCTSYYSSSPMIL
jgi:hypothetical protein